MLDGLALAETTPGPLVLVLTFVGFMGAFRPPGRARSAALRYFSAQPPATWVTFIPCFLWIFLGAPYVETLRSNRALSAALSATRLPSPVSFSIWRSGSACMCCLPMSVATKPTPSSVPMPDPTTLQPAALWPVAAGGLAALQAEARRGDATGRLCLRRLPAPQSV